MVRNLNKKRIKEGTHPWQGGHIQRKTNSHLLKNGTHSFIQPGFQTKYNLQRIENGTHNMLNGALTKQQLESGTHTACFSWECPHCGKKGKGRTNYKRWHGDNCKLRPWSKFS